MQIIIECNKLHLKDVNLQKTEKLKTDFFSSDQ